MKKHPEKQRIYTYRTSERRKFRYANDPLYRERMKVQALEQQRRKFAKLHAAINDLIGKIGKCEKCGFADLRALEIHHHFGNYNKDSYYQKTKKIITGKVPYSILCANCHRILHNPRKG